MGAVSGALKRIFTPSFAGTFGIDIGDAKNPFYQAKRLREKLISEKDFEKESEKVYGKASSERFYFHICQNKVTPDTLERIKKREAKFAIINLNMAIVFFAITAYSIVDMTFYDSGKFLLITGAVGLIKSLTNYVTFRHKAKQIEVGAVFPRSYMFRYPKNFTAADLITPDSTLKALPVTKERYDKAMMFYQKVIKEEQNG